MQVLMLDNFKFQMFYYLFTKSSSVTVNIIGCPSLSRTFVPIGEFSSTNPYPSSAAELCMTGGFMSTGFTSMYSLAVVDLWFDDSSSALNIDVFCPLVSFVHKRCFFFFYDITLTVIENLFTKLVSTALICFTVPN